MGERAALLRASHILPEVIGERAYRSVDVKARLKDLGFPESQRRVPALVIPQYSVTGEIFTYQIRPDAPRIDPDTGKPRKYETLAGSRMGIDVPPRVCKRGGLGNPHVTLYITEGSRKADAAVSRDLCCIALLGVFSWRGANEKGGLTALADWETIALSSRTCVICFDSDVMQKAQVYQALVRLKRFLELRKAEVHLIYFPVGANGEKVGLDDFLAQEGRTLSDLDALGTRELRPAPEEQDAEVVDQYAARKDGLYWLKRTEHELRSIRLTNFSSRITTTTCAGAPATASLTIFPSCGKKALTLAIASACARG